MQSLLGLDLGCRHTLLGDVICRMLGSGVQIYASDSCRQDTILAHENNPAVRGGLLC